MLKPGLWGEKRKAYAKKRGLFLPILTVLFFGPFLQSAQGSWFIDPVRYHISAHGQTSCLDCHEERAKSGLHPDPTLVGKTRISFFQPDTCVSCHDHIPEDLDQGIHGKKRVTDKSKYSTCIKCHKPHYQPRLGDDPLKRAVSKTPKERLCSACHEPKESLPPPPKDEMACYSCHIEPNTSTPEGRDKIREFCLFCHGTGPSKAQRVTTSILGANIDVEAFEPSAHGVVACTSCHPRGASFNHNSQPVGDCTVCHTRHDEAKAHAAHLRVACQACHMKHAIPVRDSRLLAIGWSLNSTPNGPVEVHSMYVNYDDAMCKRCHHKNNKLGATALVLPPKGMLCIPCHTATFTLGGTVSKMALAIFILGLFWWGSLWFGASGVAREHVLTPTKVHGPRTFTERFKSIFKALVLDVFFQRRLYKQSPERWTIHALIFYPLVFRLIWGLVGLIGSIWFPGNQAVWTIIDNNSSGAAFLFDLTGVMILLGVVLALGRETLTRKVCPKTTPPQDVLSLFLLGTLTMIGFLLEGARLAMTGIVDQAYFALVGLILSKFFSQIPNLPLIHSYLWYAHAILVGAFVAYIPFSRLFHIITAPISLSIAASREEH